MPGSIVTVGYGSRSIEDLLGLLRLERIQFLIDVRSSPISRFKPEFSGEPLAEAVRSAGMRYVFMGDSLGGRPRDLGCYKNGHVIYDLVREKPFFVQGVHRLLEAISKELRLCLLCTESRPEDCHRSKMIGVALAERGVQVVHLEPNGQHATQNAVIDRLHLPQIQMFGDSLRSRKTYRSSTARSTPSHKSL